MRPVLRTLLAVPALAAALTAGVPAEATPSIIGGSPASENYGFPGALFLEGEFQCGSSLISPTWAVTAAHCVRGAYEPREFTLRFGSKNRGSGGTAVKARKIVQSTRNGSDLALVQLASAVQGVPTVKVVKKTPAAGTKFRVLGWGQTSCQGADCNGGDSTTLRQLDTKVSGGNCGADYFCITVSTGKSPCYADSGGPGLVKVGGAWQLAGAVSGTTSQDPRCGATPVRFNDVADFRKWIQDTTGLALG